MNPTTLRVVDLPTPASFNALDEFLRHRLAVKFRDLRLFALQTSPEAFASSYEVEVKRELDFTLQRLGNPQAHGFVLVDRSIDRNEWPKGNRYVEALIEAEWLGMMVLNGPVNVQALASTSTNLDGSGHNQAPNVATTANDVLGKESAALLQYYLNGTFVHPKARGGGMGIALIKEALGKARSEADRLRLAMRCTVLVDSENEPAQRLYQRAGFHMTGKETYVQQPRGYLSESQGSERVAWQLELSYGSSDRPG